MNNIKNLLLTKKKELEEKLENYSSLIKELQEVNKALKALEPDECSCNTGCDICRRGEYYR